VNDDLSRSENQLNASRRESRLGRFGKSAASALGGAKNSAGKFAARFKRGQGNEGNADLAASGASESEAESKLGESITDMDNSPLIDPNDPTNTKQFGRRSAKALYSTFEPFRTDPIKKHMDRYAMISRKAPEHLPEIHFVGTISGCTGVHDELTEGVLCRFKVEHGGAFELFGGEELGQTQISYCKHFVSEAVSFNHPIDLHYAQLAMTGWNAPRICVQLFTLDMFGRRAIAGYGFVHIPTDPGHHRLEITCWRPNGTSSEELQRFFLGNTPALVSNEPIYSTAWRDRPRIQTCAAGKVFVEIFVVTRNTKFHGIDSNKKEKSLDVGSTSVEGTPSSRRAVVA
jgi:B9 domain-containing protein 2